MKVRHTAKSSDQPCPRVMAVVGQPTVARVDRGVRRLGIELRNQRRGCRPCKTNVDTSGVLISNPELADNRPYDDPCGHLCVPEGGLEAGS